MLTVLPSKGCSGERYGMMGSLFLLVSARQALTDVQLPQTGADSTSEHSSLQLTGWPTSWYSGRILLALPVLQHFDTVICVCLIRSLASLFTCQ